MSTNRIICENGYIPRNTQTTKTESQRNEKSEGNFNFKEIELLILTEGTKNFPTTKDSLKTSHKHLKKANSSPPPTHLKLKKTLPNSFKEASITLIPKLDKDARRK